MPKLVLVAPDKAPGSLLRLQTGLRDECDALGIMVETLMGEIPEFEPNAAAIALCTPTAVPNPGLSESLPTLLLLAGDGDAIDGKDAVDKLTPAPLAALAAAASTVFATERAGMRLCERLGVDVQRLYCGYTRRWDHKPHFEERDIDVILHVPRDDAAAHAIVGALTSQLEHLDVRVLLTDEALTDAGQPEDHADMRRGRFLARAKAFVALGRRSAGGEDEGVEVAWMPCVEAMLAGAAVVVEGPLALEPLRPGHDFLSAHPDEMTARLFALLADRVFRFGMTNTAYRTLRLDLPLRSTVADIYEAARIAVAA